MKTFLTCRAAHPAQHKGPRFAAREHGKLLAVASFPARPTGRILDRFEDLAPGCLGVRCLKDAECNKVTEYAVEGAARVAAAEIPGLHV